MCVEPGILEPSALRQGSVLQQLGVNDPFAHDPDEVGVGRCDLHECLAVDIDRLTRLHPPRQLAPDVDARALLDLHGHGDVKRRRETTEISQALGCARRAIGYHSPCTCCDTREQASSEELMPTLCPEETLYSIL